MIDIIPPFVNSLDSVFLSLRQKPKDGLHILLRIAEKEGIHHIDESSLMVNAHRRSKQVTSEQEQFLEQTSTLAQLSWCANTNKCFDLPVKAILKESAKKKFVQAFEERLKETFRHRSLGRNVSYRHLVKLECDKLQKHLLGIEEYKPFKTMW